jgi:hypothetical protein
LKLGSRAGRPVGVGLNPFKERTMKTSLHLIAIAALAGGLAGTAAAAPVVPGYTVSVYGTASLPVRLAFDTSGALYVGNSDNSVAGASITRLAPGGGAGTAFGPAIYDPDAVQVDLTGAISGVVGAVLVGGAAVTGGAGVITAIRPDQTAFNAVGPSTLMANPGRLTFDATGRLLSSDSGDGFADRKAVFAATSSSLTRLFVEADGATPDALAVSTANQIYTAASDGVIRVHDAAGNLLNGSFISGMGAFPLIEFGRAGAGFDGSLYLLNVVSGTLLQVSSTGVGTVIGTGFASDSTDLLFGADGALYVAQNGADNILRIAAVPEPASALLLALGGAALLLGFRRKA